jgi:hypothetical protein
MKKIMPILLLIVLIAGCLPQQIDTPIEDNEEDTIATLVAVAATLTAEVSSQDPATQQIDAVQITVTPGTEDLQPTETPTLEPSEPPTDTPVPTITTTPTITETPTLAPEDPVLSLGVPSVKDTFDNGSIIYQYDEDDSSFQVEDGLFVVVAKKAISYETWSLSWEELKNFYLETTAIFGEECAGKDRYGMIFRAPDTDEGYLIMIACDGTYRLSKWESEDEKYTQIVPWAESEYINSGPGGQNRLGVRIKGTTITGYINGKKVFEVEDSTFAKGRVGLMVAASNTPGFTAYLSQVVYWKLP